MWKQSYLDVRKRIEQSGRDARWEFDRKILFERSDHIAQVCSDIFLVAKVKLLIKKFNFSIYNIFFRLLMNFITYLVLS